MSTDSTTARDALKAAALALGLAIGAEDRFTGRVTTASGPEGTYVAAGHLAVARIDEVSRALHEARQALIGEIRADADERITRVDAELTRYREERQAREAAADFYDATVEDVAAPTFTAAVEQLDDEIARRSAEAGIADESAVTS